MLTNICAYCGKPYDASTRGNKSLYCTLRCKKDAMKASNAQRYKEQKQQRIQAMKAIGRSAANNRPTTPAAGCQCFYCPLMGWECRMETTPPCVQSSQMHTAYRIAVKRLEMIG